MVFSPQDQRTCENSTRQTVNYLIYKYMYVHDVHKNMKVAVIAERVADYGFFSPQDQRTCIPAWNTRKAF